ncbi:MAG TPA: preprotein translocase subunit SecE [Actinomycetota bacterium]|nr:preprotein translocase subunit SecE [Actinomycetota bacterium]
MNRQAKRQMQRGRQQAGDRAAAARRAVPDRKRERTSPRQFFREVRQELKKVNWPTKRELGTYTVVVLFTVVVLTSLVFGIDFLVGRAVLAVFGS